MKKLLIPVIMLVVAFGLYLGVQVAGANPLFTCSAQTAAATTSLVYMSAGTATTTLTLDTACTRYTGNTDVYTGETDTVLIQYSASSSLSTQLKTRMEISQDNIDWYALTNPISANATTTFVTGNYADYNIPFSTTTPYIDFGGTGTTATSSAVVISGRFMTSIVVQQPSARYIRFVFYVPTGATNGGLWASAVIKKQDSKSF